MTTKSMRCSKCGKVVAAYRKQRKYYAVWHLRKHECKPTQAVR